VTTWLDDATLAHLRDVVEWPDLGERYEIRGRIGRGGMGVVYAARDRILDREVAIKVHDDLHLASVASRLLGEARILGRLEHPGIVPVHDAGTLPDGRVYYVMKLVRGEPLDVAARSHSLNERLDLFLRICETVSFAHARGVVHRDLKPGNIMLGAFGEVLVMDWGVALSAEATDGRSSATGAATRSSAESLEPGARSLEPEVIGTPGYMAPEQARDARRVDQRADVYALGVILAALCGPVPPKPLQAIAARARAERVDERYDNVLELAHDVTRFRDGLAVLAYREGIVERWLRIYRRYELPILLVLAYMVMRTLLLAWRGI
jgi:serine/threonine protein kinase